MSKKQGTKLGEDVAYPEQYSPELLFAIPRSNTRNQLKHIKYITAQDYWNAYEFSWLDASAVPKVAILNITISGFSENIVESKSLKLYLNAFAFTIFNSEDELVSTIKHDIENCVSPENDGTVQVSLLSLNMPAKHLENDECAWQCIDSTKLDDVPIFENIDTQALMRITDTKHSEVVNENLCTHLFRSICPVTSQPDWASIFIAYKGKPVNHQQLLRYLLSFRKHAGFHEDCVEQIFSDLLEYAKPLELSIYAAFTRRGGIDINPYRSTHQKPSGVKRQIRQ